MSLAPGTRLGPYEILSALGAGGMGEVYRARDGKLGRDVAIKVLSETFALDPDRLARFKREAQVLASLNHPHIAAIYGFEDSSDTHALVLELVEGETLADRIARGAIPLSDALPIARQIADALEAAHEQGIIHRDLKPANIKVKADGTIKVLDFGLAKAMDPAASPLGSPSMSPTLSLHATHAGIILGTAAYMSPEQAAGKAVDKRSDLWAFGVVLLEMLTGQQVFGGETVSHVLASVLKDTPDLATLPVNTPVPIRRLLRRCLEKDRKRRLDSAADARLEIDDALTTPQAEAAPTSMATGLRVANPWLRAVPWTIAAVALMIAAAVAWRGVDRAPMTPVFASIDVPDGFVLGEDDAAGAGSSPTRTPMLFTPDGRSLIIQAARAGKPQLFLRRLDRLEARPIPGTDEARAPFLSPDGLWVGFWAAKELRKVPIEGGAVTTICPLPGPLGPYGAAWSVDDVIVFGDDASGRIMRVSANGGTPTPVTVTATSRRHVAPILLPDGKRVLFSDVSTQDASDSRLMVQALDAGDARIVMSSATDARLLPSGHLAFMRLGTLMTAAFDLARAEVTGEAVTVMSGVMQSGIRGRVGALNTGAGMFAVSSLGALAVVPGALTGASENTLIWATRNGRATSAEPTSGAPAGRRVFTRISPDRSRMVVAVQTPMRWEMWIADWTRDVWTLCGDCHGEFGVGVWSPDGRRLLFSRNDTLVTHALDGTASDQVLFREPGRFLVPTDWLPDGRIVYRSSPDQTNYEIKLLERGGGAGRVVVPLGRGSDADVSPDGRWLAYTSVESGQTNVVVQAFPGPGSRTQVSTGGGVNPSWSQDGRTLYYLDAQVGEQGSPVYEVEVTAANVLTIGKPRELFRPTDSQVCAATRCYDVSTSGQGFLLRDRSTVSRDSITRLDLVLNWTSTLADGQ